jgi:hypothetical protein
LKNYSGVLGSIVTLIDVPNEERHARRDIVADSCGRWNLESTQVSRGTSTM